MTSSQSLGSEPIANRQYLHRTAADQRVEQRSADSLAAAHGRDDQLPGRDGAILPLSVTNNLAVPLGDQMLDFAVTAAEVQQRRLVEGRSTVRPGGLLDDRQNSADLLRR